MCKFLPRKKMAWKNRVSNIPWSTKKNWDSLELPRLYITKNAVKFLTQALKTPGTTWWVAAGGIFAEAKSGVARGTWVSWVVGKFLRHIQVGIPRFWFCPLNMTGKLGPKWVLRTYERGELTPLEVSWLSKKGVFVEFFCAFFIWLGHGMPLPFATFARCCTYV